MAVNGRKASYRCQEPVLFHNTADPARYRWWKVRGARKGSFPDRFHARLLARNDLTQLRVQRLLRQLARADVGAETAEFAAFFALSQSSTTILSITSVSVISLAQMVP